jgi:hypothetical protein
MRSSLFSDAVRSVIAVTKFPPSSGYGRPMVLRVTLGGLYTAMAIGQLASW